MIVSPPSPVKLALEHLAITRHEEAKTPVYRRGEDISLDIEALPIRVGQRRVGGADKVEQADDDDEGRVLEAANEAVDQWRDDHRQCLRQNNQAGTTPIPEPKCFGGLVLSPRDRLQTTANDFGKISSGEQNESDLGAQQFVYCHAGRQE